MINTQIAFITSSAIAGVSEFLDLDLLKEKHEVSEEQIESAKVASNNITVKKETNRNISSIINYIKSEGVNVKDLYASNSTWSPNAQQNRIDDDYSTSGQTSTGSMCHHNCHSNCHSNCHGSRGWR